MTGRSCCCCTCCSSGPSSGACGTTGPGRRPPTLPQPKGAAFREGRVAGPGTGPRPAHPVSQPNRYCPGNATVSWDSGNKAGRTTFLLGSCQEIANTQWNLTDKSGNFMWFDVLKIQAFSAVRWALAGLACVVTNPWEVCPKSPLEQKRG